MKVGGVVLLLPILAYRGIESSHASVIRLVSETFSRSPLSLEATFSANAILQKDSPRLVDKACWFNSKR